MNKRLYVLTVPVDSISEVQLIERVQDAVIRETRGNIIYAINPEKIIAARKNPDLHLAVENATYLIPDGIGTIIGVFFKYGKVLGRITGIRLFQRLLEVASHKNYRVYFLGSKKEVLRDMIEKTQRKYSKLEVAGCHDGYFEKENEGHIIEEINEKGTDILFVALGSPKQELWLHENKNRLKVPVCMCVGGSFDVVAGHKRRAPYFFQKVGLEWLFRLFSEPFRIRRQIVLPRFLFLILCDAFKTNLSQRKSR